MTALSAAGFPADLVRERARSGAAAVFPDASSYGTSLFGGSSDVASDVLDAARLVPPVFVPRRLEKLIELGREPLYGDVSLATSIGGFASSLPVYLSAFGSTQVAGAGLGAAASAQAAAIGIPMVIGENVVPVHGHGRTGGPSAGTLLERLRAYGDAAPDGLGGVVVQQSTEDADAEVWNLVYSDPSAASLLESGRLAFELKVGQGAKPGLGGMTLVSPADAASLASLYAVDLALGSSVLRSSSPGTFTPEILRQQIRLMRNNFPRAGVWVKLPPGRDVASAASVAWEAGADAVTVDGAEGGSGWTPVSFSSVGLPLAECLSRIGVPGGCLLASGRMWEGTRVAKVLALGARAAGLGRAALLAVDTDPESGLVRFAEALALELRLLLSALGQYQADALTPEDVWFPGTPAPVREQVLS
ncbi:glutamate synthase-related protein [Amycolatopsis sp. SID8362]|uniref:glutamate synthase-related protein n=1 Tax=Amycolatopsis sp. SID8362 TaxID=2690346 RepID=UPI00136B8265|nr:glutamate synthase-related protein [Amycolatopsis sp. SID8362]NBH02660.1 glutamate synthase [Amycolatopsis sp. SID8362]NED39363.1 glutamate synthase [Amycolatopsis sp. SID8362]